MDADSEALQREARDKAERLTPQAMELLRNLVSAARLLLLYRPSPAQKHAAAELQRESLAWALIDHNGDLHLRITDAGRTVLELLADAEEAAVGAPRAPGAEDVSTTPQDARDATVRPIEEELADLAREVPPEEWEKLPADLTDNLDYYLYGTPKR